MVHILVRKYTAKPRFKPHYNSSLGKYYGTSREYVADLKAKGLEPAKEMSSHKTISTPSGPSKWCRDMTNEIKNSKKTKDGGVILSDRFRDELKSKGGSLPGDKQ